LGSSDLAEADPRAGLNDRSGKAEFSQTFERRFQFFGLLVEFPSS
jgi:hypothetical protein